MPIGDRWCTWYGALPETLVVYPDTWSQIASNQMECCAISKPMKHRRSRGVHRKEVLDELCGLLHC